MSQDKERKITRGWTRREVLRTTGKGAALGGVALSAPWIWTRNAAAAGEVNVLAFGGYEEPGMLDGFEKASGIKVNLKIHDGSDEEMVALIKSSPAAPSTSSRRPVPMCHAQQRTVCLWR